MNRPRPTAFTLIEIIISMALFAVGFAAAAALLTPGTLMERAGRGKTEAVICTRNALEVAKGKGLHTLTCEHVMRQSGDLPFNRAVNNRGGLSGTAADMEIAARNTRVFMEEAKDLVLQPYLDVNADGVVIVVPTATTATKQASSPYLDRADDHTNWPFGKVHAYKNRPVPGTHGAFSPFDFSYPSSVFDVTARAYATTVMYNNISRTPADDGLFPRPDTNGWLLTAVTAAITADAEWPEQVEGDPDQPVPIDPQPPGATPHWLSSNNMQDFRSKTGGDPGNANPEIRGYCCGSYINRVHTSPFTGPWSQWNYLSSAEYNGYADATLPDVDGRYKLPVPRMIPAIVYDKANNQLLLRYPQVFARVPQAGNTRLEAFRAQYPHLDRRLKKGDLLLTAQHGYLLTVLDVRDAAPDAATAPGGPVDWSDGTYQIVRVTPPLSTTIFTANTPTPHVYGLNYGSGVRSSPEWELPYLSRVYVLPPPVSGGASPWINHLTLLCGDNDAGPFAANKNPFRKRANTAE